VRLLPQTCNVVDPHDKRKATWSHPEGLNAYEHTLLLAEHTCVQGNVVCSRCTTKNNTRSMKTCRTHLNRYAYYIQVSMVPRYNDPVNSANVPGPWIRSDKYENAPTRLELPSTRKSHNILGIVLLPDFTKPSQVFTIHGLQRCPRYRVVDVRRSVLQILPILNSGLGQGCR